MADPVKAMDDLRVLVELQLVLDLIRQDGPVAQGARLAVSGSGPQILLGLAWQAPGVNTSAGFEPQLLLIEIHAFRHDFVVASDVPGLVRGGGASASQRPFR
jgi:hypothetical protein